MSDRVTPLKPAEVIRRLRALEFEGPVPGGRHDRMVHPLTRKVIPVPRHGGRDIGPGLVRRIIHEAGITAEEWNNL